MHAYICECAVGLLQKIKVKAYAVRIGFSAQNQFVRSLYECALTLRRLARSRLARRTLAR